MILYIESLDGDRQHFKVSDIQDLNPVFDMYPRTMDIAMSCDTLKEAVDAIVEYLDGHASYAWVEGEELMSKSLRSKAAALGLALTASVPTALDLPLNVSKPSLHHTQTASQSVPSDNFGSDPHDRFLWNVKQIESSGGKNTEHKPVRSGKYKGETAVGRWGLLKPTVNEIVNRMRLKGKLTPEYQQLESMSRDELNEHFKKNPQIELDLARNLAGHVMKRQGGDHSRAAYAWLHGHNLFPADIPHDKLNSSDYVNKYISLDRQNPFKKEIKRDVTAMNKAAEVNHEDFRMKVKNWFKARGEGNLGEPMRSSNFTPDMGRRREEELDDSRPDSQMTPMERLVNNTKIANKGKS